MAFSRKLPGLLGIPVQESAEGAAFGQLLGSAIDLLGVDPLFQAFLLPPDRADAGAGGQHLGVQRRVFIGLRNERVHRLELVLQRLVPFQRGGKHLLRDVLRDAFHFFDVVPEGFAQGAAVACRRSRSGAAVGIVHELPECRAVFPGLRSLPDSRLLQPYLERVRFASLGVDGLPGDHELDVEICRILPLGEVRLPHLFLQSLNSVVGGGHVAVGNVLRNGVQLQNVVLEFVLQSTAMTR